MPDVNFLSILSALVFEFLGLVTLHAWRFEWMALGAAALPDILIEPCAMLWLLLSSGLWDFVFDFLPVYFGRARARSDLNPL
ncbi:hypothetical protein J3F83DRAFT_258728 [Trichoderma novae-zelandiae]